jgi:glycerophosphoryl diester phosphodiesterase
MNSIFILEQKNAQRARTTKATSMMMKAEQPPRNKNSKKRLAAQNNIYHNCTPRNTNHTTDRCSHESLYLSLSRTLSLSLSQTQSLGLLSTNTSTGIFIKNKRTFKFSLFQNRKTPKRNTKSKMVQFGRHQQFFLEQQQQQQQLNKDAVHDGHSYYYIVPYNDAKHTIIRSKDNENDTEEADADAAFEQHWRGYLQHAVTAFDGSMKHFWKQNVFAKLYQLTTQQQQEPENDSDNNKQDDEDSNESLILQDHHIRGATPTAALILLAEHAPMTHVQFVLDELKRIHTVALMNSEALRKLVKKYDKKKKMILKQQQEPHSERLLSCQLLPELYASNIVFGLSSLQQDIDLLRSELGLGEFADSSTSTTTTTSTGTTSTASTDTTNVTTSTTSNDGSNPASSSSTTVSDDENQELPPLPNPPNDPTDDSSHVFEPLAHRRDSHAELVHKKLSELHCLREIVTRMQQLNMLHHVVAHRGFHNPTGRSDRRPVENSLQAYEMAWTNGISLCECDIALTKDERIILAHDEDFSRLALDPLAPKSHRKVGSLTYAEVISIALQSGSRPPLLQDVLASAQAIGGTAQLIVEIKPGNRDSARALAKLFATHHDLMAQCAVVMSFDCFTMQTFQQELSAIFPDTTSTSSTTSTVVPTASPTSLTGGTNGISPFKSGAPSGKLPPRPSPPRKNHRRYHSMGIVPAVVAMTAFTPPKSQQHPPQNHHHHQQQQQQPHHPRLPKLLVLTVCHEPQKDVELHVSVREGVQAIQKIERWIHCAGLDGVYLQYEPEMLTPAGSQILKALATTSRHGRGCFVGVWGHNGRDPDDYATFCQLVQQGHVSFVNTDLPMTFFAAENNYSIEEG